MSTPYPRSNPGNLALTPFQMVCLELICVGNPGQTGLDAMIDMNELLDRLADRNRATTKQSLQFMIRTLVGKGLIEKREVGKRRGWNRVGYVPTAMGMAVGAPRPSRPVFHETEPTEFDLPEG